MNCTIECEYDIIRKKLKYGKIKIQVDNNSTEIEIFVGFNYRHVYIENSLLGKSINVVNRLGSWIQDINVEIIDKNILINNKKRYFCKTIPFIFWEMLIKLPQYMKEYQKNEVCTFPVFDDKFTFINIYMIRKVSDVKYIILAPITIEVSYDSQGRIKSYGDINVEGFVCRNSMV